MANPNQTVLIADDDDDLPLMGEVSAEDGPGGQDSAPTEVSTAPRRATKLRGSRDQELRANQPDHDAYGEDGQWDKIPFNFPTQNLPARPGFVQRLIRTKLFGQDDVANLMKAMAEGWRPRLKSTVPLDFFANCVKLDLGPGRNYGEVVGSHDMILMERPEAIHRRYVAARDQYQQGLDRLIGEMVEGQAGREIREAGGTLALDQESSHRVGKSLVADD